MELNEFLENRIKNMSVVREESYRKWIMNFLKENDIDGFCDDSYFSDELPEKDYENVRLLSFFYDYVEQLAFEQNILPEIDEFGDFEYIFCIDNTLFSICTIIRQGAFTSIKKSFKNAIKFLFFLAFAIIYISYKIIIKTPFQVLTN